MRLGPVTVLGLRLVTILSLGSESVLSLRLRRLLLRLVTTLWLVTALGLIAALRLETLRLRWLLLRRLLLRRLLLRLIASLGLEAALGLITSLWLRRLGLGRLSLRSRGLRRLRLSRCRLGVRIRIRPRRKHHFTCSRSSLYNTVRRLWLKGIRLRLGLGLRLKATLGLETL